MIDVDAVDDLVARLVVRAAQTWAQAHLCDVIPDVAERERYVSGDWADEGWRHAAWVLATDEETVKDHARAYMEARA